MNIVILFMGGILIMGSLVFFTAKSTDDVEGGVQNKDGLSKIAPFILCFGVVVLVLTVYLFIASFDWSWSSSGSYGGHKSFTEYGLSYHKPPSYYHYDYSWLKWIFYPIDVFIFLIGCILIRLGLRK